MADCVSAATAQASYNDSSDNRVFEAKLLGESCVTATDCVDPVAVCPSSECACPTTHYDDAGTCTPLLDDTSSSGYDETVVPTAPMDDTSSSGYDDTSSSGYDETVVPTADVTDDSNTAGVTALESVYTVTGDTTLPIDNNVASVELTVNDVANYGTDVSLDFTISSGGVMPTNAQAVISFGDGSNDETVSLNFASSADTVSVTHAYSADQVYSISVEVSNNIDSESLTQDVQVGSTISGLSLTTVTNVNEVATSGAVTFTASVTTGSSVSYNIDYGDGSLDVLGPIHSTNEVFTHSYMTPGAYQATLETSNFFGNQDVSLDSLITVQDPIQNIEVTNNGPVAVGGDPITLSITIGQVGTDPCLLVDFGDDSSLIIGPASCNPQSGIAFEERTLTTSTMTLEHIYSTEAVFTVTVTGSNLISSEVATTKVYMLSNAVESCDLPLLEGLGLSTDPLQPREVIKSKEVSISPNIYINCQPPKKVVIKWTISELGGDPSPKVVYVKHNGTTLYLKLLDRNYGDHSVEVEVYPEGVESLKVATVGYISIKATDLEASIAGGSYRSTSQGSELVIDASGSRDPDVDLATDPGLAFGWYCQVKDGLSSGLVDWTTGTPCFTTGGLQLSLSTPSITVDTTTLVSASDFLFRAVVTKDSRTTEAQQTINLLPAGTPSIVTKCLSNCAERTLVNRKLKLEVQCSSCASQDEDIGYQWSLYDLLPDDTTTEVPDLAFLSSTDITSRFLSLNKDVLTAGQRYRVLCNSGDAFATYDFRTNLPPTGGSCNADIRHGTAWDTKFSLSCSGWVDEDTVSSSDPVYTLYSFWYIVQGGSRMFIAEYSVVGDVDTVPTWLPSGDEKNDHHLQILVVVADEYGASSEESFTIKVTPPVINAASLADSNVLNLLEASGDLGGLFSFVSDVDQLVNTEDTNDQMSDEETVQAIAKSRESLVAVLASNAGSIEQPKQCTQAASAVKQLAKTPSTLTQSSLVGLSATMLSVVDKRIELLQGGKTADPEEAIELTNTVVEGIGLLLQATNTPSICPEPDLSGIDMNPKETKEEIAKRRKAAKEACEQNKANTEEVNTEVLASASKVKQIWAMSEPTVGESFNYEGEGMAVDIKKLEKKDVMDAEFRSTGGGSFSIPNLANVMGTDDPVLVETTIFEENVYAYGKNAERVKSPLQSFSLSRNGDEVAVENLEDPIIITIPVGGELQVVEDNYTDPTTSFCYRKINVEETGVALFLLFFVTDDIDYEVYVGFSIKPNDTDHDLGPIDVGLSTAVNGFVKILINADTLDASLDEHRTLNLAVRPKDDALRSVFTYRMSVYSSQCLYWDASKQTFLSDGCVVTDQSTAAETVCACTHLTMFASNWFVPPNTIDFDTVFDDFGKKLVENMHVFVTMILLIVLYFVLLLALRHYDKKDVEKWGVTPLMDNMPRDTYHYQMTVHTGTKRGAGTTSTVFFVVGGEDGQTEIRKLEGSTGKALSKGSVNNYILSVPTTLGPLLYIRVWHDNTGRGENSSWFLSRMVIKDIQTNELYAFLCDRWLAVDQDDGSLERSVQAASREDLSNFSHLFSTSTRKDMSDDHLWFSLMSRPTRSRFTRVQRLTCCLALLFSTMIANAMWYKTADTVEDAQTVEIGPFNFSPQQLFISIVSSLVSVPVSVIIVALYKKSATKPASHSGCCWKRKKSEPPPEIRCVNTGHSTKWTEFHEMLSGAISNQCQTPTGTPECAPYPVATPQTQKKRKKPFLLPYWCVYIAWCLSFAVVILGGFFTLLYSFEWGRKKSSMWLTAFFLSFLESVILIQPIKIIGIAVVLSLVFKKSQEEQEDEENDIGDDEIPHMTHLYGGDSVGHQTMPAHRVPFLEHMPMDDQKLKTMRHKRQKEEKMFAMVKEITAYLIYVLVICTISYDNRDPKAYWSTHELNNLFVTKTFARVNSTAQFWNWMEGTLVNNLYAKDWYNSEPAHWRVKYFLSDMAFYRIGSPRLRLARVDPDGCETVDKMDSIVHTCYPSYTPGSYDGRHYEDSWSTVATSPNMSDDSSPWLYRTTMDLDGVPIWGRMATYSGGGYVKDLGNKPELALDAIAYLKDMMWIDRATRGVFVEFNLFNPNSNLFTIVSLLMEFPYTGGTNPYPLIQSVRLYNYVGGRAIFRLFLELVFVIFVIYYMFVEYKKFRKERRAYFISFWNVLELINILAAVLACAFYGVHYVISRNTLSKFHNDADTFTNFQYVLTWDYIFGIVLALLVFLASLKLLKLLRFNRKVTQLCSALTLAVKPLLGFFVTFAIIFGAFAMFGTLAFGKENYDYRSFISTLEILFAMMLMSSNVRGLQAASVILGPIFFTLYFLMLVLVIINLMVAILNENFYRVKAQNLMIHHDYQMVNYMVKQLKKLMGVDSWPGMSSKSRVRRTRKASKDDFGYQPVATPHTEWAKSLLQHVTTASVNDGKG